MSTPARRRKDRLEVRLTTESKALLAMAAAAENKSISAFVLDAGLAAAAEALADLSKVTISADGYSAFLRALDARPAPKPRLDRLLSTPSVLD
jgi:uncharacterized protein (DUF1778 family)